MDQAVIRGLAPHLTGTLLCPGDDQYDHARTIWNAMIDKRPAAIARCETTSDVVAAVNFAREHDLLVSVRGGGHNVAGNALCDDGLMIDLSLPVRAEWELAASGSGEFLPFPWGGPYI